MGDTLVERLSAAPQEVYPQQLLAKFPRIAERIASLWGRREIEAYFQDLMLDERGGRRGFPADVLMEILELRTYHRSLYPPLVRSVYTWSDLIDKDIVAEPIAAWISPEAELRLVAQDPVPSRAREL